MAVDADLQKKLTVHAEVHGTAFLHNRPVNIEKCKTCQFRCMKFKNAYIYFYCVIGPFIVGEKPFVCSICGKAFTQAGARKAHERGHKEIKQYQCSQCDKSYKNKCSLTVHLRRHTGTKPCKCNQCGKGW